MTEADLPNSYTTSSQQPAPIIALDLGVLKTAFGIIKIVEMVLDLLGFICIMASGVLQYLSRGAWFNTVAMGGFWYSGIILALYVFHVPQKLSKIPWKKIEFIITVIWTFFYLIAASLAANIGEVEAYAAAAFFGFVAMIFYGYDAWDSFSHIVIVRTTTTTVTTPTQY